MARPRVGSGGGLAALTYVLRKGREAGGLLRVYRRLRSRNACKTCGLGMGGQLGGMRNEVGHFPEVCKKSVQAQAGDMAGAIAEDFFQTTPLAHLERFRSRELERLGRLVFPVLAGPGDTHFRRVSWSEALDRAAAGLRQTPPEEAFFYSSGRSSNEAAFLMQVVARAWGTANVHNCSFYCHNASSVALGQVYGSGTASVGLDDLGKADLALVAGANPGSNHPRLVTQLVALRRLRGRRGVFLWAMGLTHHVHGVDNVLALANLALARGWLGRPGSGLLPIRGHSNVQGVGSVGVTPQLKAAFAAAMEELYGIPTARTAGLDTYASMAAAAEGRMRAAVLLGGNLFASNPDRAWAGAALRRLALTVSLTTKLNEGHVHGRGPTAIILPVLARDEESQCTTQESMFNFVRLSEGGEPAVDGDLRSEVEVIAALAELLLPPGRFDWSAFRSHQRLRQEMAKMVPGYAAIGEIDQTRREFHVAGRVLHAPPFPTGDGKAHFQVTPLPAFAPPPGEFRLMTVRSEGQFNTVVYEEEDLYRGNRHRDVVMMAAEDAARLGLGEGDPVVVETETGRLRVTAAIAELRPGNLAMYYPEANALVPRRLDARSKTPAFKSVAARLRPANGAEAGRHA